MGGVEKALSYLESCASEDVIGAYRFWPHGEEPDWCPVIHADADDTAIIALELYLGNRLSREKIKHLVCKVLLPNRYTLQHWARPRWIQKGAFNTWLGLAKQKNIVDVCVNINVVALLAGTNLKQLPGYQASCDTILAGINWAGESLSRYASIAPYYPNPKELCYALENAVEMGADELCPSLALLKQHAGIFPDSEIVFGNVYSRWPVWTSKVLSIVRSKSDGQ